MTKDPKTWATYDVSSVEGRGSTSCRKWKGSPIETLHHFSWNKQRLLAFLLTPPVNREQRQEFIREPDRFCYVLLNQRWWCWEKTKASPRMQTTLYAWVSTNKCHHHYHCVLRMPPFCRDLRDHHRHLWTWSLICTWQYNALGDSPSQHLTSTNHALCEE